MKFSVGGSAALLSFVSPVLAVPTPEIANTPAATENANRLGLTPLQHGGISFDIFRDLNTAVQDTFKGLVIDEATGSKVASAFLNAVKTVQAKATPSSIPELLKLIGQSQAASKKSTAVLGNTLLGNALGLVLTGVKLPSNFGIIGATTGETNSFNNKNPRTPQQHVFPKKNSNDAPFSVSVADLRSAVYIPPTFTFGKKMPVILVPGTGSVGGDNFAGNLMPLLKSKTYADPVYLNIPGFLLGDAQANAEYVAYAINYISGISNNRQVAVVSWSQGGINTQWALKYWPSTRKVVQDFVAISPDFKGTVNAGVLCPGFPKLPCPSSVLQQFDNSTFIATLRSMGGASAYVPTTTIYSGAYDEIVEPQQGTSASAFLNGASNNEVQSVCNGRPAGTIYSHEGVLYNPLTFALLEDALTHDGPGRPKRLNLNSVCGVYTTTGLNLADVLLTEAVIPQAAANILLFQPKMYAEPPIKGYAS